jgi:hypothetical protein
MGSAPASRRPCARPPPGGGEVACPLPERTAEARSAQLPSRGHVEHHSASAMDASRTRSTGSSPAANPTSTSRRSSAGTCCARSARSGCRRSAPVRTQTRAASSEGTRTVQRSRSSVGVDGEPLDRPHPDRRPSGEGLGRVASNAPHRPGFRPAARVPGVESRGGLAPHGERGDRIEELLIGYLVT